MLNDDKKKVNRVPIEPETHDWLVNQANAMGEGVGDFAGALLDVLSSAHKRGTAISAESIGELEFSQPDFDIFWEWYRVRQRERRKQRILQAAAIYATDPTEEGAEGLAQMCELAGMDYTEVVTNARRDPFSSIIADSRNGTKFGECIRWLPGFLSESGGEVKVAVLRAIGRQQGFTPSMLDRVKRAIQNDPETPNIASVRIGAAWAWKIDVEV